MQRNRIMLMYDLTFNAFANWALYFHTYIVCVWRIQKWKKRRKKSERYRFAVRRYYCEKWQKKNMCYYRRTQQTFQTFKWFPTHSNINLKRFINATNMKRVCVCVFAHRRSTLFFLDGLKIVIKWIAVMCVQMAICIGKSVLCIYISTSIGPIRIVINCYLLLNFSTACIGHINKCVCMIFIKWALWRFRTFIFFAVVVVVVVFFAMPIIFAQLFTLLLNGFDDICFMWTKNGFELLFSGVFNVPLNTCY